MALATNNGSGSTNAFSASPPVEESVTVRALEEASTLLHEAMRLVKGLGPVARVPLHEMSLTLAALDLALTFRVHTMLPGYEPGSRRIEVDFNCLKSAVKHLKRVGGPLNHHPHGGYGGADSILLYLTHALATTVKCLRGLRRASRAKEQWRTRLRFVAFVALAFLWKRKLRTLPLLQGRRLVLWVLGLSYAGRKLQYQLRQRSVDGCHKRLLTVLRLWVIVDCVMVHAENWKDGGVEYRTLIARLNQEDVSSRRWLSRQLLEAVPPPPETAFWYEASPVAACLRRFMSVVYASFGLGVAACETLAGKGSALASASSTTTTPSSFLQKHGWPLIGLPTTGAAFLYYALRPQAASRDACQRMSPAPIAMLQRAWTSLDNPLTRWVASTLVARRQGLAFQRRVVVAGLECTLMARADPSRFAKPRCLFFVHGGGFVAHLFLADMAVLTAWTLGLGEEGVLLIPEYTLVPEGRYPKPTQELLGVYRALLEGDTDGGLGFTPHTVAVAGESAGGNLAASLLVAVASLLQEQEQEHRAASDGGPKHHPGLASLKSLSALRYNNGQSQASLSCQSLASYGGEEGEEEEEALIRAASLVKAEAAAAAVASLASVKEEQEPAFLVSSTTSSEASEGGLPSSSSSSPLPSSDEEEEEEEKGAAEGEAMMMPPEPEQQQEHVFSKLRMPDGVVLFYPVLNFCLSPSPSRSVHMADPILPLGMFTTVVHAYMPSADTDPTRDPLISPYFVHDALLQQHWPPSFIGVGGFDPLLDDTVDFDVRLRHLGVPSTLRLGRDLPHGFFGLYGLDPSATKIMEEAGAFLQACLLSSDEQETAAAGAGAVLPRSSSSLLMVAAPAEKEDSGSSMSSSSSEAGLKEGEVALLELAGAAHHQGYGNNVGEAAAAGGAPLPLSVTTPQ